MTITPRRDAARRMGAAVVVAGLLGAGIVAVQAAVAARREYVDAETAPSLTGTVGPESAPPLRLIVLGDSTAAGLGVDAVEDTVGGRLASLLAGTRRRVTLQGVGVSGSRAADLGPQVSRALIRDTPDIAVILIGANDAIRLSGLTDVERHLGDAVRRLRAAGVAVVVGTCPDMGAARAFAEPLRSLVGWNGRRVATASTDAVRRAGGVPVDLAARTGAVFRADPGTLSADEFHPSADGYHLWALALYPAVYDASLTTAAR